MVYAVRVAAKVNVLLVAKPRPARRTGSVVISQLAVIPIMSAETMVQLAAGSMELVAVVVAHSTRPVSSARRRHASAMIFSVYEAATAAEPVRLPEI